MVEEGTDFIIPRHFFPHKNNNQHTVTLAVRRITGSHTAVNIRTLLDEEWGIYGSKLFATLTDNGSNMVAAFKAHLQDVTGDSDDDDDKMEEMEHEICEEVKDLPSMEDLIVKKSMMMNSFATTASVVFAIQCSLLSINLMTAAVSNS